jgi:hypothetical protein
MADDAGVPQGPDGGSPPNDRERSTVTLRSRHAISEVCPLEDPAVARIVEATARGIAERIGVRLLSLTIDERAILLTVAGSPLVAMGLANELRRSTDAWHRGKFGSPLWHGPMEDAP